MDEQSKYQEPVPDRNYSGERLNVSSASTNTVINTSGTSTVGYVDHEIPSTVGEFTYRVGLDPWSTPPANQIRPINITQVNHGYIVVIGCQTIVVETKERLIEKLAEYITNPSEAEQKYNNKQLL